ncbi:MAG: diguanylate cyclase domain-containing protein [Halomonadaceae bacterium]|uniref:GGDEF domain-containing protein n=1 Tax=Halomonas colorata TaxID=2742615 RepID=A0ABR9G056_9GAMM|nr:sensor domain-containing diguanylate cyclase [Halomonas colorata]MBE0464267.1 GGDEF domain-containing protein [Halomonas colorata]
MPPLARMTAKLFRFGGHPYAHQKAACRLQVEKVCLLYEKLWQPVLTSIFAGGLLVAALWTIVSALLLMGWLAALILVSILRLRLAYRYHHASANNQKNPDWLLWFSQSAFLAGCVWGAASILFFSPEYAKQTTILTIVMAGIAAGGVTTLSSVWWVAILFVMPILLPLPIQFLLYGGQLSSQMCLLVLLFMGLILVTSRRLSHIIHDNIALRVEMASREALLQESEDRYQSIYLHSPLGGLHLDSQGVITNCNDKLLEILGGTRDQLLGYCMLDHRADQKVATAVADALEKGTGYYEGTFYLPRHDQGTPLRSFFNAVRTASDHKIGGIAIIEDFTEQKRSEAIIYRQAYYDALTDLPNRRLFIDSLNRLSDEKLLKTGLIVFLDMDRFKLINDSLGHAAGDDLLIQVARRLEQCKGETGMAARLSGDEFVLLALFETANSSIAEQQVQDFMQRLEQILAGAYRLENRWLKVTPSIGYTCFETEHCDAPEMLKQADIAMYQAKAEGRNQMKRYQPWMRKAVKENFTQPGSSQQDV